MNLRTGYPRLAGDGARGGREVPRLKPDVRGLNCRIACGVGIGYDGFR